MEQPNERERSRRERMYFWLLVAALIIIILLLLERCSGRCDCDDGPIRATQFSDVREINEIPQRPIDYDVTALFAPVTGGLPTSRITVSDEDDMGAYLRANPRDQVQMTPVTTAGPIAAGSPGLILAAPPALATGAGTALPILAPGLLGAIPIIAIDGNTPNDSPG